VRQVGELLPDAAPVALRRIALALFALGVIATLLALQQTWRHPILESNSFRQTQTAVSAYWIAHGGPIFAYETPVLGAPWSIPFEFPLYQVLVAGVHSVTHLPLDGVGRLVSWIFFALTIWQLVVCVRALGGSRDLGLLAGGLLMLSPLYVFWSRTFMMESTALFFSVAFVSATATHLRRPRAWTAAAMVATATLAALVKVTTFVAFGLAGGLLVLWDLFATRSWRDLRRWLVAYVPVALAGLVAFIAIALWVRYADALKTENAFGHNLTSANLDRWNFGTLAQRKDPQLWTGTIFGRTVIQTLGGRLALGACVAAAIMFGRRALAWLAVLIVLYLVPFLVFTNVNWVHHYYQYANALFLVCAIAFVVAVAREGWRRWAAYALVALVGSCQVIELVRVEWPEMTVDQSQSNTVVLGRYLRRLPPDGVILVTGYDWSSEVAYYSRHRAINVPAWVSREQLESLRTQPMLHTGGHPIVGVVDCSRGSPELAPILDAIITEHTRDKTRHVVGTCVLWR
jgi:hypothetical protein